MKIASVRRVGVTGKRGDRMAAAYQINGVTYVVDAVFQPVKQKTTLRDRLKHYLNNNFADLTHFKNGTILSLEYVLTAGKEDLCSQKAKATT